MVVSGFYKIDYGGNTGSGFGMLALYSGRVTGIDEAGIKYDGEYFEDDVTGSVQFHLRATVPADVPLVVGVPAKGEEWTFAIDAHLAANFATGIPNKIRTPFGAATVTFTLLQALQPP
jgi:hypothetical protein